MRRSLAVVALCLAGAPTVLHAQYFGQNRVQYENFKFKVLVTEHFDVYYYDNEKEAATDAARMAERSYARLAKILGHEFKERKPIILYASHSDFVQTNALGGEAPSEATGGVTDFARNRMVLPFTGSYADLQHVLQHEMTHQFQYDIWSLGKPGNNMNLLIQLNPPLWFVEGMAEYLSIGQVDPNTAMWLRDAVLAHRLPSIHRLETDPNLFPYRYGQAILAFVGERYGDEAIGNIMRATVRGAGSLDGAFRRVLGISLDQLSDQWQAEVERTYGPEVAEKEHAQAFAEVMLNQERSKGTLHLAPALSPDGSQVAYFSEADFYFVDLYLADAKTGKIKRRVFKSTYNSNYETFRFINSAASWSADGRYLAVAAKRGPRDDILVIDVKKNNARRIQVGLNGITTPTWSPDGKQLVFSGLDGGISDLFIVNQDGTGLRRLTHDKNADLHPVWSPDGKTIAFSTDRGPRTDFDVLRFSNTAIALYHLDTDEIEVLPHMEVGTNGSPQWSPDGKEIAYVSDRTGIANIFLYELDTKNIYQITDLYTGVAGIVPLSPVLSWAGPANELAFVYYQADKFDVYSISNPDRLKKEPFQATPQVQPAGPEVVTAPEAAPGGGAAAQPPAPTGVVRESYSLYRTRQGFRPADQPTPAAAPGGGAAPAAPPTMLALMDSATMNLPDTSEFTHRKYQFKYQPDYIARPTIGYVRDNYGSAFFGGSEIGLSDILGNHSMIFTLYINGRITEALVGATYINQSGRLGWATGIRQEPYYLLEPTQIIPNQPAPGQATMITNIRRVVLRSVFVTGYYPLNRFQRFEATFRLASAYDNRQSIYQPYDPISGFATADPTIVETHLDTQNFAEPGAAYVFDNSLQGFIGPFMGRRTRIDGSVAVGGRRLGQILFDNRRYDRITGFVVFATRLLYVGRLGRDGILYPMYLGSTDLVRGNTSGSYDRNECSFTIVTYGTCAAFDRLVGSQIAVGNVELRFPILNPRMRFLPAGFPALEGAAFADFGVAWNQGNTIKWNRGPNDDPSVRSVSRTVGGALRLNAWGFAIFRFDYSFPLDRNIRGYWTISIGPVF
jgi:WD40 repeat protein